jgi:dTDP-4-amino-4,6-dideoxygalactose transaminase
VIVPFLDLKAQYRSIKEEIQQALNQILEKCAFILGEEVEVFEKEFAEYSGASFGVAANSGTSALHLALLAAGIKPGDEVITVPFTFVATVAAILYVGAKPVLVDVDPRTLTIDVNLIEAAVTPHTKAILPVHLHGLPSDIDPIMEIASRHGLIVIEDAAQAHGAEYKGRRVGGIGHLGCFSFYPGKNLGAYGEGGMVVTNNPEYDRAMRMLRDWGQERKYHHVMKGFNYRMDGFQAAVLRVKLRHLEDWTNARRSHAARYGELLKGMNIKTPVEGADCRHVYHVYAMRAHERDALQDGLHARGVQTAIHYPIPVHLQEAYVDMGYSPGDFPCSEEAAKEVLSLPMYAEMSDEQLRFVSAAVQEATGG